MINEHNTYYVPESVCKDIHDSLDRLEQECESAPKWTLFQAFYTAVFLASFGLLAAFVVSGMAPIELIEKVMK